MLYSKRYNIYICYDILLSLLRLYCVKMTTIVVCVLCIINISNSFLVLFREEMYIHSSHGTLLVFLQNDSGFEKWGPTAERLAELAVSFQAAKRKQ